MNGSLPSVKRIEATGMPLAPKAIAASTPKGSYESCCNTGFWWGRESALFFSVIKPPALFQAKIIKIFPCPGLGLVVQKLVYATVTKKLVNGNQDLKSVMW